MKRRTPLYALYAADAISLSGNAVAQLAIPWYVLVTTGSAALTGLSVFFNFLPIVLSAFFGGVIVDRLGFQDDEHPRGSRERRRRRGDTAPGSDRRDRALAAVCAGVPGSAARRARSDGARCAASRMWSSSPGCRMERASGIRARIQQGSTLVGAPIGGVLVAALRSNGRPSGSMRRASGLGRCHRDRLRAATTRGRARRRASRPILRGAGRRHAVHLGSASAARPRAHGPRHEPDRGAGSDRPDRLRAGEVRQRGRSRPDVRRARRDGARAARSATARSDIGCHDVARSSSASPSCRCGYLALATLPPLPVALGALAVAGFAAGPINPLLFTVLTEIVPSHLRGRVFGAVRAGAWASIPLGVLLGGVVVGVIGVAVTFLAMGVLLAAVVATGTSTRHFVRWTA